MQTSQPRGPRVLPGRRRSGAAGAGPQQGRPWGRDQWRPCHGRACVRAGHPWAPSRALALLLPPPAGEGLFPGLRGVGFPEPRTESGSVAWAVRAQLRGLERASVKPSAWGGRCGPEGAGSCPSLAVTSRGGEQAPPPNLPCLAKQAQGMWVLVGSGRPPVLAPPRTHF